MSALRKIMFLSALLVNTLVAGIDTQCLNWQNAHVSTINKFKNNDSPSLFFKFENSEEFCPVHVDRNATILKIYSFGQSMFENNMDLNGVIIKSDLNRKTNNAMILIFMNLNGFNEKSYALNIKTRLLSKLNVRFYYLKFRFFQNSTLITKKSCVRNKFDAKNFFGSIRRLQLFSNILYSKEVCPYVFTNVNFDQMVLIEIINSIIYKNQLEFLDINETAEFNLNAKIKFLLLNVDYDAVTQRLLNKYVFREVKILSLTGIINTIQVDLFVHFKEIRLVKLGLDNYESFYYTSTKWMNSLNTGLKINLHNTIEFNLNRHRIIVIECYHIHSFAFAKKYTYPDEDICLFKDFPHNQLVYPTFVFEGKMQCTCTLIWLIQHSVLYLDADF